MSEVRWSSVKRFVSSLFIMELEIKKKDTWEISKYLELFICILKIIYGSKKKPHRKLENIFNWVKCVRICTMHLKLCLEGNLEHHMLILVNKD